MDIKLFEKIAAAVRVDIIKAVHSAGSGHPGGSLSAADLVTALYFNEMNIDPANPKKPDRDKFILSKGHAAPVQYAALAERGFFPKEELLMLRKLGAKLQGHPDMHRTPGVEMSTGSLGQGISVSIGMALANKIDDNSGRIYALLGDGELQEGIVWEAVMAASHYKLDNLTAIVDWNGLQIDGKNDDVMCVKPIDEKFKAFGWNVLMIDGHDFEQIFDAYKQAKECKGKPTVIIARTHKGRGVSFMTDQAGWHGKAPNDEEAAKAIAEIEALFADKNEIAEAVSEGIELHNKKIAKLTTKSEKSNELECNNVPVKSTAPAGKMATRQAYGETLREVGATNKNLVVLDGDLSKSTMTVEFKKLYAERFLNMGISEQNLYGTAAGLALSGKTVCASTFAMFATGRAFEIVRNTIGHTGANVKVCATHAGITVGEDGATHQTFEDIALMRTIPGMMVINPGDAASAKILLKQAIEINGPVYVRLGRTAVPCIYKENEAIEIGKGKLVREGKDVTIIATGIMVNEAATAAETLAQEGVDCRIIDMHTIKPIDEEIIVKAAVETGAIVTAEEHSVIGGLGSAVAEVVVKQCPVRMVMIGQRDTFGESGKPDQLKEKYGMTARDIIAAVTDLVRR